MFRNFLIRTGMVFSLVFAAPAAVQAETQSLQCNLTRIAAKSRYMPTELEFSVARRFGEFVLKGLNIPDVQTPHLSGKVTSRSGKRIRYHLDSQEFIHDNANLAYTYGSRKMAPFNYDFYFSLNTETLEYRFDVQDTLHGMQTGVGYGVCRFAD